MRHDKLERELNLLLLLTENHNYTMADLCDRTGLSRRNLYYYLEFFRDAGFKVENNKPYYRVRKDSPFFRKLDELIHITEDEAITIRRMLEKADDQNLQVRRLKAKLDKLYDFRILDNVVLREQAAQCVSRLYEAIKLKRCAVLKGYSSPHSDSLTDRQVEPFLFLQGNNEIRCFETATGMNKTFKISRMQGVELLEREWEHERQHRHVFTDVFMFSDEQLLPVSLRLNRLACSLLKEEYPATEKYIAQEDDSHWLLQMNVCSYVGIGRFALGLFDSVEVLGDEGFKAYLRRKLQAMGERGL